MEVHLFIYHETIQSIYLSLLECTGSGTKVTNERDGLQTGQLSGTKVGCQ